VSRRLEILGEMGLAPVWRLRERDAAPALAAEHAAVAEQKAPVVEPPPARLLTDTPRPLPQKAPIAVQPVESVSARAAPGEPGEREQRIARMSMDQLKVQVKNCTACGLCKSRNQTVFGTGDETADWMIVGEAPGAEEDARGEPFVGQAGKLLDNMLAAIKLSRQKNVYIANVLKCRPPGNRNPEAGEVAQCAPHLARQIALVQPKLIIAMGRFAAQTLLNSDASIASMRGKLYRYQGVPTIVSYHPAYLLRTLPDKAKAWEDLCFARSTMASATSG
jgi:uracil-DNA glycosylase family 4